MKILEMTRIKIDPKDYLKRFAEEKDAQIILDEEVIVTENGKPVIMVKDLDFDDSDYWKALNSIQFIPQTRSGGLITKSRILGYSQRIALRSDFCSRTSTHTSWPNEAGLIENLSVSFDGIYRENFPDIYHPHREWVEKNILPGYRMLGTVYTQAIINKDNRLAYHKDNGNVMNSYSAMITFTRYMDGGNLVIPEFNVKFAPRNKAMIIFSGQSLVHGVTPIRKAMPQGKRYSVVFYSLKAMKDCLPPEKELQRIRKVKMERNNKGLLK